MFVDRVDYLNLMDKLQVLERDNQVLQRENQILVEELQKQKQLNYSLVVRMEEIKEYSSLLNSQVMSQNEAIHCDMKGYITQLNQKQKEYLDQQFLELEKSSFQKCKVLQLRNASSRIENHQLTDFSDKIKKIYKKRSNEQPEPSLKDLVKWVKVLAAKEKEERSGKKTDETGSSFKQNKVK